MTRRRFARMRCRRMMFPASIRIKSNRMQLAALLDCSLGSIAAARSSFFFVLIRLLSKPLTPDLLSRLQALSPDLLLRGALASSDPCNSELCFFMAVLNYDLVSNLHLASITTQLHTMVADIESMREMAILTPGDPESYWLDRFGSLRPPFAYAKSRHVPTTLTPSSRRRSCRHHRHLLFLCRCLRLLPPLRPRLALVEGGHRQLE